MTSYTLPRSARTTVTSTGERTAHVTYTTSFDRDAGTVALVLTYWNKPYTMDRRVKMADLGEDRVTFAADQVPELVKDLIDAMFYAVAKTDREDAP